MDPRNRNIKLIDWCLLILILLLAAFFRWRGLNWDQLHHYHPDERYIAWVASSVDFFGNESFSDAFRHNESTFNPFYWPKINQSEGVLLLRDEPRKFAYGHLPLYVGVAAENGFSRLAEGERLAQISEGVDRYRALNRFDRVTLVGRWVSGLFDLLTIIVVFLLGRNIAGTKVGLLAASFLAFSVLHIQQAHYFVSDPLLAFFVVLASLFLLLSLPPTQEIFDSDPNPFPRWLTWAGIATGLAIGSKFSAIMLGLPALIVILTLSKKQLVWRLARYGLIVLAAFFVTNPFALLDRSCLIEFRDGSITLEDQVPAACYLENISDQSTMVNGGDAFPFIRQYDGTLPYIYHIENQINWGIGAPLAIIGFIGFFVFAIFSLTRGVRLLREGNTGSIWVKGLILMGWCLPYFLTTGQFHTKFMRYLLPLTPFLVIFAAWLLYQIKWDWVRRTLILFTIGYTFLYAVAFSSIYTQVHPWHAASQWMLLNVPSGSVVINEAWDEYLPSPVMIDGRLIGRDRVQIQDVNWLSRSNSSDSAEKLKGNLETMSGGDYFVIPSNRSYGVVPRLPSRYPLSGQFHQLLFQGDLGYEVAFVQDRPPHLFGVSFVPHLFSWPQLQPPETVINYYASRTQIMQARADESFTVYDQPTVIVFKNTGRLSAEEMLARFTLDNP